MIRADQDGAAAVKLEFTGMLVELVTDGATLAFVADRAGNRLVRLDACESILEAVDGTGEVRRLAATTGTPRLLAFAGDEHLVTMNDKGQVQLREIDTDTVLDSASIPVVWGIEQTSWRAGDGGGDLGRSPQADRPSRCRS